MFVGVGWGESHHDLCLLDRDGSVLAARRITDGLAGWASCMRWWPLMSRTWRRFS